MAKRPHPVDEYEYMDAAENYVGWCTECEDFTTDAVEPDGRKYTCAGCASRTVYGAEEALLLGLLTFADAA